MRSEVTYHCSACGAPQEETTRGSCHYCGAPRVPIGTPDPRSAMVCGGCKALVGGSASFCPHCGDPMAELASDRGPLQCPHCLDQAPPMTRWGISPNKNRPEGYEIDGCSMCGGIWLDAVTLKAMVAEAADLANKVTVKEAQVSRRVVAEMSGPIRYRRCPVCSDMMARQNFERVSGIILDTCPDHGTFFDTGELQDVLNFVRSGGLVLAQQKKAQTEAQLSAQEANVRQPPAHGTAMTGQVKSMMLFNAAEPDSMLTRGIGEVTIAVIRWSASWAVRLTKMALLARRSRD